MRPGQSRLSSTPISASHLKRPLRAVRCRARRWAYSGAVAFERITVDPNKMGGLPCIRDLRVTVSAVLGQLAAGRTVDQVLEDYPYLERDDIFAALEYGAAAVRERELPLTKPA